MSNIILSIAGSDSSGGAGIQADIKTITALNSYPASVITLLTAQNTKGVQQLEAISPEMLNKQLESIFSDLKINAIKVGAIPNVQSAEIIYSHLKKMHIPIVLDPVFVSSSGYPLTTSKTLMYLYNKLLLICSLITPNFNEAEKFSQIRITNIEEQKLSCLKIAEKINGNVLITGGHTEKNQCEDVLYDFKNKEFYIFENKKIVTQHTHGTGCTLSSAVACFLAQNYSLKKSVELGIHFTQKSILNGKYLNIGTGTGPVIQQQLNYNWRYNE